MNKKSKTGQLVRIPKQAVVRLTPNGKTVAPPSSGFGDEWLVQEVRPEARAGNSATWVEVLSPFTRDIVWVRGDSTLTVIDG